MAKTQTILAFLLFNFFISVKAQEKLEPLLERGAGQFEYTGYEPLKNKPITVFYYIPTQGDIKKMKILISMHGAERSGLIQRGVWRNLAEKYGFIVIAPQFLHANGYTENDYQFGGVSESRKQFILKPAETWTYKIIESLFDYIKQHTGNTSEVYNMFGHSAGGQFVHRYLLMNPEARVEKAVAANPGNYTYPDDKGLYMPAGKSAEAPSWPFSLKSTPFATNKQLAAYFKRKLVILIGTADTATVGIDKSPGANLALIQGVNRHERAFKYFAFCQSTAKKKGMEFNWKLVEVPNAGHSSAQMVYGQATVRNSKLENNEKVYHLNDLTDKGAFQILISK
ncbi:hypothetical protein [Pedobacter sp. UBA4863]|uniref:hypothetical protein n=1 Tax=Pedobacter sp. UBA4863 TaxID=1947060 RepID=UPI0025DD648E|nr:hypothetical protein [Pedobacter sp. UBA4863]